MSLERKKQNKVRRRTLRVRKKFKTAEFPRVSVFRSLSHIYAQIISDKTGETLASSSTLILKEELHGDKKAQAHLVGIDLAKKAKDIGIEKVVFDRGPFRFHGRVKAIAEGLNEGGLLI